MIFLYCFSFSSFPPSYVPEEFGVDWLYKELHSQWLRWLPQETANTILKGGFYSVLVRPKFRIISINTNFCNNKNWYFLFLLYSLKLFKNVYIN